MSPELKESRSATCLELETECCTSAIQDCEAILKNYTETILKNYWKSMKPYWTILNTCPGYSWTGAFFSRCWNVKPRQSWQRLTDFATRMMMVFSFFTNMFFATTKSISDDTFPSCTNISALMRTIGASKLSSKQKNSFTESYF